MKRLTALLFLLVLMPVAAFAATSFSAILSPIGGAGGSGFAVITIDGTTLHYSVLTQNTATVTQADIVDASETSVVSLNPATLSNGTTTISTTLANQIAANPFGYAIEIRTSAFPNGALLGPLARSTEGEGSRVSYLPVVGKVGGINNTNFVTDMRIVNNGGSIANVTLDYFAQSAEGNSAPAVTKTVTVVPGEQKVLDDMAGTTLGITSGLGGLRITSDQNVDVSVRVINDQRAAGHGTAGFSYSASPSGDTSGTISFLSSNADYRTNAGYFNPGATPVTATFVAHAANGVILGSDTITIPGYAMTQQPAFSLISSVPAASQTQDDYFITWSATGPLLVYGAVTDNVTGDAVLNQ